jgi:N utilization substance protein B
VAEYAEIDARQRAAKYLPTSEDLNVNTSLAVSKYVTQLSNNPGFKDKIKNDKLERYVDDEWVKKIYYQLLKSEEYAQFTATKEHTFAEEKEIVRHIWEKQILGNEEVINHFLDELPGWEDDSELIAMLMQNLFKGNSRVNFKDLLSGEKKEYAHELLYAVIDKEDYCMELIEPKLKNWDKERVALIDLLLLRMGVCEFLYFPTIPTKVTINEYIDIAKQYSTQQSGQFINGVLDNILKQLTSENKIKK